MGSLRNPIGPLPSSIYWRRRAVALGLLGLLVLLGLWFVTLGGDGGSGDNQSKGTDGKNPGDSTTITPGPVPSGPHYSQRPGGRGESGSGGASGSAGSGGSGTGASGTGGAGTGGGGTTGTGGGGALGTGDGKAVPIGSSLPDCSPGAVRIAIRSVKDAYRHEKPKFEIVVKNSGGSACKLNFGATAAIMKITRIDGDDRVWASDDCPRATGPALVELPGSGETKRTVEWDRKRSAPHCATPSGDGAAGTGTYRAEVRIAGVTEKVEFALEKD